MAKNDVVTAWQSALHQQHSRPETALCWSFLWNDQGPFSIQTARCPHWREILDGGKCGACHGEGRVEGICDWCYGRGCSECVDLVYRTCDRCQGLSNITRSTAEELQGYAAFGHPQQLFDYFHKECGFPSGRDGQVVVFLGQPAGRCWNGEAGRFRPCQGPWTVDAGRFPGLLAEACRTMTG